MADKNRVQIEFFLPCGHPLSTSWIKTLKPQPNDHHKQPEHYYEQLIGAAEMLGAWLESRAERHECGLVTEDNPNGLPRNN